MEKPDDHGGRQRQKNLHSEIVERQECLFSVENLMSTSKKDFYILHTLVNYIYKK